MSTKIIFFMFAGREANMVVARPHIEALLHAYPNARLDLWDLTREASDALYLDKWAEENAQVFIQRHLHPGHPLVCRGTQRRGQMPCTCIKHKPPYEEPYRMYSVAKPWGVDDDTVFVKFDDDVIWMDTDRFGEMLEFLETHPYQIASANVANNAVCAKYDEVLNSTLYGGGLDPEWDEFWWSLHMSPALATLSHEDLLYDISRGNFNDESREPFRTRTGEKVSINFIAMKFPVLQQASNLMESNRWGDEGAIDSMLPWIIPNFRVAHLSFGSQEKYLPATWFEETRAAYAALTKETQR